MSLSLLLFANIEGKTRSTTMTICKVILCTSIEMFLFLFLTKVTLLGPCLRHSDQNRVIESFELEGTPKGHLVQIPCSEQGCLQVN